jgi:transcription elongation GreA/GreB family factor
VKKAELISAIIERLQQDLSLYHKAALAARAEATHEQSRAENKYDTRGLEASYLARGQSRQALEIESAIAAYQKLPLRDQAAGEPIDTGALVELQSAAEKSWYFIGPRAGGTEIQWGKKEVLVITPESPLGSVLLGKKKSDRVRIEIGGSKQDYRISAVW